MILTGYSNEELVTNRLNIILPKIVSEYHTNFVQNFIMRCTDSTQTLTRKNILLKDKEGLIIPIKLEVFPNISLKSGI
jgi:hypothetical protein